MDDILHSPNDLAITVIAKLLSESRMTCQINKLNTKVNILKIEDLFSGICNTKCTNIYYFLNVESKIPLVTTEGSTPEN